MVEKEAGIGGAGSSSALITNLRYLYCDHLRPHQLLCFAFLRSIPGNHGIGR